jgi:uncharacterized protein
MSENKIHYTYNYIHNLIKRGSQRVEALQFEPDYILCVAGGGMVPSRILRTFIDVPIISLTVSYYDEQNKIRPLPKIIQWVDIELIKGKNILIVDEVDDTRKTIGYLIENFKNHVKKLGVFVVNNKNKEKVYKLPKDIYYFSCEDVEDKWIIYPWDNSNFLD